MPNRDDEANHCQSRVARIWRKDLAHGADAALDSQMHGRGFHQVPAIAAICYKAFLGTRDEAAEEDFQRKVSAILMGRYGRFMEVASVVHESPLGPVDGAILVTDYAVYGGPVIALIVVDKTAQQRGTGTALLAHSLAVLQHLGHTNCCARVTQGNLASERLFQRCGFLPGADICVPPRIAPGPGSPKGTAAIR